jgi:hypothetical protein
MVAYLLPPDLLDFPELAPISGKGPTPPGSSLPTVVPVLAEARARQQKEDDMIPRVTVLVAAVVALALAFPPSAAEAPELPRSTPAHLLQGARVSAPSLVGRFARTSAAGSTEAGRR